MRTLVTAVFVLCVALCGATAARSGQITHTVVQGDTLWSIAAASGVPVAALERRNHLTDQSILQLGQTIVLKDAPSRPHVVASSAHPRGHRKPKAVATHARIEHALVAQASPRRTDAAAPSATANAMWVATHTGQAPPPPALQSISLAERIVAFDEKVTHTALRYVGVPYAWGGTSFNGVDCSGFVQAVFEHNGISLPRTADSQFEVGRSVRMSDLRPGDLVFFETYTEGASHVGIYLGGGRFIHASSIGVRVDALAQDYYAARYIGARRLAH